MLRKYTLLLLLCCIGLAGTAQDNTAAGKPSKKCSCGFRSINQVGVTAGEKAPEGLMQSINGMWYGSWFAGVGVGVDTYKRTSIPLFLDIRKELLNRDNTPYVYADGGYHFIADSKKAMFSLIDEYKGGLFYDLGLGYKFSVKGMQGLLLSAGYSVKNMTQLEYYNQRLIEPCTTGACNEYLNQYKYRLNRLSFKIGFQF